MSKKIWLVEKSYRTTGPQKWDEGPNDTKYWYDETTHSVKYTLEEAQKEFDSITYFQSVRIFECSEIKNK